MLHWSKYIEHEPDIRGKRKKYDNTIYSFDIETTSYIDLYGNILSTLDYQELSDKEKNDSVFCSNMYIWQFSINDIVYYGRTWVEFIQFLERLNEVVPELKIVFIHNLAFEFQYLKSYIPFDEVVARTSHKAMKAYTKLYNIEFRCSYMMSNCALKRLPDLYNLPVKKMVGDLDYNYIRHSETPLTEAELGYCENDCLVVYHYIKYELQTYDTVKDIPITSTGHVRRELKEITRSDYKYKRLVAKAVNTNPHIYNLLIEAFAGGYTHANYIYTDRIIENVDSWDFTSSYPYVLVTCRFPSTKFQPIGLKRVEEFKSNFAYLVVVRFTNVESNYFNNFISKSKCRNIINPVEDNGRIIRADSLEMTLTDIDLKLLLNAYSCDYEILECYYSIYNYLPKKFINFVLDKYVIKTKYKGVPEKQLEYQKEKGMFNSLYGMSVTNNIRDEVVYTDSEGWVEIPLSNSDIIKKLSEEENTAFLSFAYGVWVTAYARNNLLQNVMKLDPYVVYCDTDSIKVCEGYDKSVIEEYNNNVIETIKKVSNTLDIPYEKYAPKDIKGEERMLGLFDDDGHYTEFITQGAKKYAVKKIGKDGKEKVEITVSGVPKSGAAALNGDLNKFRDDLVFEYKDTGKNLLMYAEDQKPNILTDLYGNECLVTDKSGCCIVPTTYVLGKAQDYAHLLSDDSSRRAIYKE